MEPILIQLFMIMSIILVVSTLLILFLAIKWTKDKFMAIQRDIKSINNLLLKQSASSTTESSKNDSKRTRNSMKITTTPRMVRKCQEWALEEANNDPNKKKNVDEDEEDTTLIVTTRYHNADNYRFQSPSNSCQIQIDDEDDRDQHPNCLIYDTMPNSKPKTAKVAHKSNRKHQHDNSLEYTDLLESFKDELNNSYRRFLQTLDHEDSM